MTVIGDKSRFAVEFDPILNGNFQVPECHFTYWIDDQEVGNQKFSAAIGDLLEELRVILLYRGKRQNPYLFHLPPGEAIREISGGLTGTFEPHGEAWFAYNITYTMSHGHPLEDGNRFNIYLIDNEKSSRVIVENGRSGEFLFENFFKSGEVDEVLLSAWDLMNR